MKKLLTDLLRALAGSPRPEPEYPGDDAPFWRRLLWALAR